MYLPPLLISRELLSFNYEQIQSLRLNYSISIYTITKLIEDETIRVITEKQTSVGIKNNHDGRQTVFTSHTSIN